MTETHYTVLGIPRYASTDAIKTRYRELIREVHPDTLPNASRYWKQQAEERTKDLNEAYRVLSDPEKRRFYDQQLDAGFQSRLKQATNPNDSKTQHGSRLHIVFSKLGISRPVQQVYVAVVAICLFLAGLLVVRVATRSRQGSAGQPSQSSPVQIQPSSQQIPSAVVSSETGHSQQGTSSDKRIGSVGGESDRSKLDKDSSGSERRGGQLALSGLTPSDRQAMESACSTAKYSQGAAAYHRCLQGQLAGMAEAPLLPDLSRISSADRQSMESACSTAKYSEGPAAYRRCLQEQLSGMAGAPPLPDLSRFSSADRQSMVSACTSAKYSEGPAAYHRCLQEQLKGLSTGH